MKPCCLFLLALYLSCSCAKQHPKLLPMGIYTSEKPGRLEGLLLYMRGYRCATGSTLALYKDHSYHLINCGNVAKGRWHTDSGKLFLHMTYNNWRLDTFRKYGFEGKWPEVQKEPMIFRIEGNQLRCSMKKGLFLLQYRENATDTTGQFYQGQ